MTVDEAPERRPVLEQEEEAEDRENDEEDERRHTLNGSSEPFDEGGDRARGALGDVLVGARGAGAVDAGLLEPRLSLVSGSTRARFDLVALRDDAAEHHHEDHNAQNDKAEQNEQGARDARYPLSLQPAHNWCRHGREYQADQHGLGDH